MTAEAKDADLPRCQDCGYRGRPIRRLSPRFYVSAIPFTLVGLMVVVVYPLSIVALAAIGYWLFVRKTCPKCKSENITSNPNAKAIESDVATQAAGDPTESPRVASAPLPPGNSQVPNNSSGRNLWIVAGIGAVLFLLFFHIVPAHMTVFPKASPSFADTFIDLDDFVKRHNEGSFIDQMVNRQTYVFRQLREKGLIVQSNKDEQKSDAK